MSNQEQFKTIYGDVNREMQNAPETLVRQCQSLTDAIRLCVHLSGFKEQWVGERLGMSKSHMSKCMNGLANFPPDKLKLLQQVCGNRAPTQKMILDTLPDMQAVFQAAAMAAAQRMVA